MRRHPSQVMEAVLETARGLHRAGAIDDTALAALEGACQSAELEALRHDIDLGIADMAAGRVSDLDIEEIKARGRQLLAVRKRSTKLVGTAVTDPE